MGKTNLFDSLGYTNLIKNKEKNKRFISDLHISSLTFYLALKNPIQDGIIIRSGNIRISPIACKTTSEQY